ncbi:MAG: ATP-binding protein [Pseudomonadota bacterium]
MGMDERDRIDLLDEIARLQRENAVLQEDRARLLADAEVSAKEVLDAAPIMIMLLDGNARVQRANRAACAAFPSHRDAVGLPAGRLLGCRNAGERLQNCGFGEACEACHLRRTIRGTLDHGVGMTGEELRLPLGPEGNEASLLASTSILRFGGEELVMLCLEDITEQRRAEAQARKNEEMLRESQRVEAVGRLAGGVAHDFNNLLTAILGHARLAMEGMDPGEPVWSRLDGIYWAGKRAASLTGQLLAFSRRQMLQKKVRDLNKMVEEQTSMLGRLIGQNVTVALELDEGLPPVEVDASHMAQVLLNLIVNAREAMPTGGEVTVSTDQVNITERSRLTMPDARPGQFVRLTVKDTGVGMAPEILSMIFEPFFSTKEGGSGMGLPVVHGLVRQHEGWLHVASAPGRGTSFHIYLPASSRPGPADPEEDTGQQLEDPRRTGERVLIVEDEESLLELASIILTEKGFEVFTAANASDAQGIFDRERGRFDLIFSDVVLPDGNGVDLTQSFMKARPGLPVLLTSGYADHRSRWHVIQDRGLDFMRKPYTPSELLQRIRGLLEG